MSSVRVCGLGVSPAVAMSRITDILVFWREKKRKEEREKRVEKLYKYEVV
jgi:hypothetical protein